MVHMKKSICIFAAAAFAIAAWPQQTSAIPTGSFGVFTRASNSVKIVNSNGEKTGRVSMKKKHIRRRLKRAIPVNIHSNPGVEWVVYDNRKNRIIIVDQASSQVLDQVTVYQAAKKRVAAVIAVGDVDEGNAGDEILICRKNSKRADLKTYTYDEDGGFVLANEFQPFGNNRKNRRGCGGISVGNVDGDNDNDIAVVRNRTKKRRVKLFRGDGDEISQVKLPGASFDADFPLLLADIEGDGTSEIVAKDKDDILYVLNRNGQIQEQYDFTNVLGSGKRGNDFTAGDTNGDGAEELFIRVKGPTAQIFAIDENNDIEQQFEVFPNATRKKFRKMFVAPFVTQ